VLAGFVGPEEGGKENEGDEYTATDKEKNSAHDTLLVNCFLVA